MDKLPSSKTAQGPSAAHVTKELSTPLASMQLCGVESSCLLIGSATHAECAILLGAGWTRAAAIWCIWAAAARCSATLHCCCCCCIKYWAWVRDVLIDC